MSNPNKPILTASIEINAPIAKVWTFWNNPADIMQWNNHSDEWHNTKVENDLRVGGQFLYAMATKDGSSKFDFAGTYDKVETHRLISYTLNDGRRSIIKFEGENPVKLTENFEPEASLAFDIQRDFCQAVLNSFKRHVEGNSVV